MALSTSNAGEVLDRLLRQSARTAAAAGTAACYALCRGDRAVGYYALAMSSVAHRGARSRLGPEFGARAVIVDAIDDQETAFYRHFGDEELEDRRLWRRLADVSRAVVA